MIEPLSILPKVPKTVDYTKSKYLVKKPWYLAVILTAFLMLVVFWFLKLNKPNRQIVETQRIFEGKSQAQVSDQSLLNFVVLDERADGIFHSLPLSPIDVTLVLKNLLRLGQKQVFWGDLMVFSNVPIYEKAALDMAFNQMDQAVLALPLAWKPVSMDLPSCLKKSIIPASRIQGDIHLLPAVNQIAIADIYLGTGKTMAGFNWIEGRSEKEQPLLVNWEGQVLPSFTLLAQLAKKGVALNDIWVELGKGIRLGSEDHWILIDEKGNNILQEPSITSLEYVEASSLLDRSEALSSSVVSIFLNQHSKSSHLIQSFNQVFKDQLHGKLIQAQELGTYTKKYKKMKAQVHHQAPRLFWIGLGLMLLLILWSQMWHATLFFLLSINCIFLLSLYQEIFRTYYLLLLVSLVTVLIAYIISLGISKKYSQTIRV